MTLYGDEITAVGQVVEAGKFKSGKGSVKNRTYSQTIPNS